MAAVGLIETQGFVGVIEAADALGCLPEALDTMVGE